MIDTRNISEFELSQLARAVCGNYELKTLLDIAKLSERDVLRFKCCGRKTLEEFRHLLTENGFKFYGSSFDVQNKKVTQPINKLPKRSIDIFTKVINGKTLSAVGEEHGLCRARVRQIVKHIRDKLMYTGYYNTMMMPFHPYTLKELRANKRTFLILLNRRIMIDNQ